MKKIINIILSVMILTTLPFIQLTAQERETNEVSAWGGFGVSTLKYSLNVGDYKYELGGLFGIGYTYFFNDDFGIGTGLELSLYNSKATIGSVSDSYMTNDGVDDFELRYTVNDDEEKQNLMMLTIPIMLQFQYPLFDDYHLFYASIGGKIGFPIRSKYKTPAGATYITSAYYPEYDLFMEGPENHGLGTFTGGEWDESPDLDIAYMLSAEAGIKWEIAESFSLYTGVYCDYGLNDIASGDRDSRFLVYNRYNPTNYRTNSVLNSQYTENGKTKSFTDKVTPMALGIKFRLTFRIPE